MRRREKAEGGEKGSTEKRPMERRGRRELEVEKESRGKAVKKGIRGIGGRGSGEGLRRREKAEGGEKGNIEKRLMERKGRRELEVEKER